MKLSDMLPKRMRLKTISPHELYEMIKNDKATVLDVNNRQSWINAHIPSALNLDPVDYSPNDLPSDKMSTLVFYCSNRMCKKAPNAALRAEKLGYKNVKVMKVGISGWLSSGLPTEKGE